MHSKYRATASEKKYDISQSLERKEEKIVNQGPDIIFSKKPQNNIFKVRGDVPERRSKPGTYKFYPLGSLAELITIMQDEIHDDFRNTVRFLLTQKTQQMLFAKAGLANDGPESSLVPSHFLMTGETRWVARCSAAGDLIFNDAGLVTRIDHSSGDFKPSFECLVRPLIILRKNNLLADPVIIEKITDRGLTEDSYKLTLKQLDKAISNILSQDEITKLVLANENKTLIQKTIIRPKRFLDRVAENEDASDPDLTHVNENSEVDATRTNVRRKLQF
ncbi:MAG: hypothetical protein ABI597_01740 [Gammaproteobacteria bacterium]